MLLGPETCHGMLSKMHPRMRPEGLLQRQRRQQGQPPPFPLLPRLLGEPLVS